MPDTVSVVGSINVDHTISVESFPRPGQTLRGTSLSTTIGGKGANQAVAAARAGAMVHLVGAVGDDDSGHQALDRLRAAGVDIDAVRKMANTPTGTAWITVADQDNTIVVIAGANDVLSEDVAVPDADVILCQLETPRRVAEHVSANNRTRFMLNAAPSCVLPDRLLSRCDTLIVNEHELCEVAQTAPVDPAAAPPLIAAARRIIARGAHTVVVTLGRYGALLCTAREVMTVAAPPTPHVVDTTGAGDAFCGVYAARIAAGDSVGEALRWGVTAGSLSVRHATAQSSYAGEAELRAALSRTPPTTTGPLR